MSDLNRKIPAIAMVMWLVFSALVVIEWNMPTTEGHVVDDAGEALQLFSYYNPQVSTEVTIDGDIAQNVPFYDEWDGAFVREITLSDFDVVPTTFQCYLFFQNDDDWLYIGILYQTSNSNQANSARLYFDEGNEPGRYDGSHDDLASATNENYVMTNLNGATLEDGYWDGTSWDPTDGDALYHFDSAANSGGNYLKYEFRVPLDPKEDGGGTGSDLNIVRDDELGFFINIYHAGFGRNFTWEKTSYDPTDFNSYADLKLGIMTKDRSFYSTYGKNTPVIDGDITNDFGWSDCYQREILLTNFEGTIIDTTIFICQDPVLSHIYIGFIIRDDDNNANDVLRLYFEEGSAAGPFGPRTGALSGGEQPGGPEWEHYQQVSSQGVYSEGWFDAAAGQGIWKDDSVIGGEAADDGDADANYYNPTGTTNDRYEFEFVVPYDPVTSPLLADGIYDLWINNHDLIGMLIRFYDSDMAAGEEYFFWDVTSNADKVMTSDSPDRHIAPGWAYLQTGCAWVRLVSPVDGSTVNGNDYIFRIDADDEDGVIGDDVQFVGFQIEGETTWTSLSQRASGSPIFETTWDTTKYDNGIYNIRIVVQDNDGITMWRTITVAIVNPTSIAPPTGVVITSPAPGTISGTQTVFVTAVNADRLELYVDGEYVNDMAPTGNPDEYSYTLNTKNYDDGYHQLRARAINGAGESSGYETYTFDNWDDLLSVDILSPAPGEMLSGVYTVIVDFEDDSQDNTAYPGPGYAELYVDNVLTVVEYTETEWPVDNWGYEITLDTVWFVDGSHALKTLVYDPEGNSLADTVLVNFVNEPSLQVMQPATGEVISGTSYPLTIKATDPNGDPISDTITNPQYRVDYGMWYDMANTLTVGHIVISEVLYDHPTSTAEWVELFNPTSSAISIAGLTLSDDAGPFYVFPGGATIPAWGTIVVATNALSFESVYGYLPDYDAGLVADRLGNAGDFVDFAAGVDYVCWEGAGLGWTLWTTAGRSLQRNPYMDTDSEADWLCDVSTVTPGVAAPVFYIGNFDTTTLSDGPHVIEFQVTDVTGAIATGSVNIIVDNILLDSISITNPQPGDIIKNMYTVIVDPAPESEAQYAELYVDDAFAAFDGALDLSGNFEFSLLTTGYTDGSHNLKIMVYDLYDNSIVNTTSVLIQNEPSLYVISPKSGEVIRGIYEVNISAVDTDGILDDESPRPRYRIDGGMTWYDLDLLGGTSNYISDFGELDTTLLTEGLHTIEFEVMDSGPYGISTMKSLDVIVDNSRPTGFPVLPSVGQNIEGTYTFSIMANDNLDVDHVDITFDNIGGSDIWNLGTKRATYNSFTGYYELTVVTTTYTDGAAQITVDIYDKAGNVNDPLSPIILDYFIDNNEPVLSILQPSDDEYVSGVSSTILASATDGPFTPIVEYKIDTGSWNPLGGGPLNWNVNWDTTLYKAGEHTITVRARDALNHISQQTVVVIVDNNKPVCAILSPVTGEYIEGALTVKIHASDTVGIDYVNVTVFGTTVTTTYNSQTGYYEYIRSTTSYPDGVYDITAEAYDFSGMTITDGPLTFYVDNTEPVLTIIQPLHDDFVSGVYPILASVDDVFLDTVEYKIDSTNWMAMAPLVPWTGSWNTTSFSDGEHTLTVRAVDNASHIIENSIVVWVDNNQPTLTLRSPIANEFIGGMYTFQAASMDSVGVDRIEITVFGITQTMSYNPLTGYYEYTVNTYTQTDGTYDVNITSYDLSGKWVTVGPTSFNVDNNVPLLTINDPTDRQYIFGDHTIWVTSTDTFISNVDYKIDTTQWIALTGPAPSWTASLNTLQLTDGGHILTIRAQDAAGHVTEQSIEVIVDNNNPVCAILSPVSGEYVEGTLTVKIHASDTVGIDYVNVTVFGTTVTTTYNSQTGYYEFIRSTTSYPDGVFDITAEAYDFSGMTITDGPITFYVDNTEPVLTIIQPLHGEYVSGIYPILAGANDVFLNSVEYKIDSANWVAMAPFVPWTGSWNTTSFSDGEHTLTVRAVDNASHIVENSIVVWVDNNQPTLTLRSPIANEFIGGMYTFQAASMDSVGVDKIEITVFGITQTMSYNPLTGYYEYTMNTYTQTDGTYDVNITSYDLSGKWATVGPRSFNVDNNAPLLTIDNPTDGQYIFGDHTIWVTSTDTFISNVDYKIDTTQWNALTGPAPSWTASLNTSQLTDGGHILTIRAQDAAGHVTEQSVEIIVDNTDPSISISMPIANQYIDGVFTFQIAADDSPSVEYIGVDYVEITVFGDTHFATYNAQTGYYEYTVSTYTITDGTYNISAWVYDLAGRSSYAGPVDFNVDNNAPLLVMNTPHNGDFLEDVHTLNVSVTDAFVLSVEYRIDSTNWLAMTQTWGTYWEAAWNTSLEVDGAHRVSIRALDHSGKLTEQYVDIFVDNFAPTCTIVSPAENQYIEDIFTFQIAAVDNVGIDYVTVGVYNMNFSATYNMQSGYYEFPLDTRLKPEDNVRNVSAWAYDLSGKSASDGPVDFRVDNHPPVLNIIYPENEDYISGEMFVNISALDAFIGPQEYSVDDRGWDPIVVPWNTTAISDGWHTLSIRVFDMIGHLTQQTINVYVDNIAPRCSIISPVESQFLERIYTFEISATDLVGIDYVTIDVFNMSVEIPYNSETGYYEYGIDTRTVEDGTYEIQATSFDKSGKSSPMDSTMFRVDNTPPDLTILSPKNGEYVKEEIPIDVQVSDAFDYTVKYTVDDSGWTQIGEMFNTSLVSDNEHLITVRATDEAGHVTERTVTVIVDNIAPELVILEPKNGTHVSGELLVSVYAGGGVEKVTMRIDEQTEVDMVSLGINAPYELTVDTRELADGYHTIHVNSIDFTGQESNRETAVFADNSGPDITIVRPGSFAHQKGTIRWEINTTDDTDIAGVYLKFDSGEWRALLYDNYTDNYTFSWRTTEDDNRGYDYEIKAVDTLGNEEIIRGGITVKNPTNLWRAFQENLPGIGFLFLVFFIVLCFVLLKVGLLQSWYREEKKAPKSHVKPEKQGKARRLFARKKKGAAPVKGVAVQKTEDDTTYEFEKIEDRRIPVPTAAKLPPPPGGGKKSLMESIGDIEITDEQGTAPRGTSHMHKEATPIIDEMKEISLRESEATSGEKRRIKKRFKKKKGL